MVMRAEPDEKELKHFIEDGGTKPAEATYTATVSDEIQMLK